MKKIVCCFLIAVFLTALFACDRPPESEPSETQTIKIGISVYDQYDTYISLLTECFSLAVKEKESQGAYHFSVIIENADNDQVTQNKQVDKFIQAGCDIICVNLVERTDATSIINRAESSGTPILFFNRELVSADLERSDYLYYVGAEAEDAGVLQGQLIADLYTSEPKKIDRNGDDVIQYAIFEGETGHQDSIYRTQLSIETLAAVAEVELLGSTTANWSRTAAESTMRQWISKKRWVTQYGETTLEVVFCNNDDMALGVIDALEKASIPASNWPVIVGIDGTRQGLEAVAKGKMYGTVLNDAKGQGEALLELACSLISGEDLPFAFSLIDGKYIRLPYQIITPDNINLIIARYDQG